MVIYILSRNDNNFSLGFENHLDKITKLDKFHKGK